MSSTFGTLFRITTFGESHGQGVGAVIDGCPPKIPLDEADIQFVIAAPHHRPKGFLGDSFGQDHVVVRVGGVGRADGGQGGQGGAGAVDPVGTGRTCAAAARGASSSRSAPTLGEAQTRAGRVADGGERSG